jgi:hypothetical protein
MNQSIIGKGFSPNTYNHRFAIVIERNILFFIYFWLLSASNCPLPLIHLLDYVQLYSKISVYSNVLSEAQRA